jgi:hypothetical protein
MIVESRTRYLIPELLLSLLESIIVFIFVVAPFLRIIRIQSLRVGRKTLIQQKICHIFLETIKNEERRGEGN